VTVVAGKCSSSDTEPSIFLGVLHANAQPQASSFLSPVQLWCCRFFILPADLDDFKLDLAQNPKAVYIRKPVASSRGRGVRVVTDPHALDAASLSDVILQHYIPNPLLIGGCKFDLRVYVAVTSVDPLRVYVYKEGENECRSTAYRDQCKFEVLASAASAGVHVAAGCTDMYRHATTMCWASLATAVGVEDAHVYCVNLC
jgi:hypothetical protein